MLEVIKEAEAVGEVKANNEEMEEEKGVKWQGRRGRIEDWFFIGFCFRRLSRFRQSCPPMHYGSEQPKIGMYVPGHLLIRSLNRMLRSQICLLRAAYFSCALRCAHMCFHDSRIHNDVLFKLK